MCLVLAVCDTYATNIIRGSYLTLNFSTPAALFFIFFLVLASGVVGLLHRWLALTRAELVTIYIMLVVACCIPGMGFTQFMIPCLLGSTYYATPENEWEEVYNQYIPEWMIPRGNEVARYFFEGLPEGATIPWEAWVVPLSLWFGFFLTLGFAMICSNRSGWSGSYTSGATNPSSPSRPRTSPLAGVAESANSPADC